MCATTIVFFLTQEHSLPLNNSFCLKQTAKTSSNNNSQVTKHNSIKSLFATTESVSFNLHIFLLSVFLVYIVSDKWSWPQNVVEHPVSSLHPEYLGRWLQVLCIRNILCTLWLPVHRLHWVHQGTSSHHKTWSIWVAWKRWYHQRLERSWWTFVSSRSNLGSFFFPLPQSSSPCSGPHCPITYQHICFYRCVALNEWHILKLLIW